MEIVHVVAVNEVAAFSVEVVMKAVQTVLGSLLDSFVSRSGSGGSTCITRGLFGQLRQLKC